MTDTTISPGLAESEGESESLFDDPEPDPDFEIEIELPDRSITMCVEEGESVALTLPDGRAFAQVEVSELDS